MIGRVLAAQQYEGSLGLLPKDSGRIDGLAGLAREQQEEPHHDMATSGAS